MKPQKPRIQNEQLEPQILLCDDLLSQAILKMQDDLGASFEQIADRLFTYAAAMSYKMEGKAYTVMILRKMAKNIERGALDELAFTYPSTVSKLQ